jgi:hypothetical protein
MKYQGLILSLTIFFAACLGLPASAQEGTAGMPGTYLHTGVGARAMAMGQAFTALAKDGTAIYWNPAGLANQDPYQIYFMHSSLFMDTNFDYVAATAPTRQYGNFGLGLIALTSGNFQQTSELNEELGTFGLSDMAFMLSWSKVVGSDVAVGLNYKLVTQKMLDYSGIGHGFDLGLKRQFFDWLYTGFTITNLLTPKMTLANVTDVYPRQLRLGLATSLFEDKLLVSTDISKILGWGKLHFSTGLEYHVLSGLDLRIGVNHDRFTMGIGFAFNKAGIGYGAQNTSELGMNHLFAVSYAFGGFGVGAQAVPDVFSPVGEQNISKIELRVKSRSEVSNWIFEILDKQGSIVRSFTQSGELPEEIIWDGRNDRGDFVEDGKFDYRFEVATADGKTYKSGGALVSIFTEGPSGTLGLKNENGNIEDSQNEE